MKTGMFKYSLLAGAMAFSGLAMAVSPSTLLQVKGQVSTGTCTTTLSTPDVDLGTTSIDKLPATGSYEVKHALTTLLNVDCTSPLRYQISLTDNRSDSAADAAVIAQDGAPDGTLLGLGKTDDGIKIGAYRVGFSLIKSAVNGSTTISAVRLRKSMDAGAEWVETSNSTSTPSREIYAMVPVNNVTGRTGSTAYIAVGKAGEGEPCATTSATFEFLSDFFLSSELRSITDQKQIDGSVTFNLDYL